MSLKDKLDQKFDVGKRFGYKVNKWIFRSAFILMILVFGLILFTDGWDVAVHGASAFVCPEDQFRCVNPYLPEVCNVTIEGFYACDYQYISGGEVYGVVPSFYARLAPYLVVGIFLLSLLINHLIYNRNFRVKKNG